MRIVVTGQADLRLLDGLLDPAEAAPAGMGGIPPAHEIRMLLSRGHEVVLVTLDPEVAEEVVLTGERFTVIVGPCRPRHAIRTLHRAERRYLTDTIRSVAPDVVHAHWTYEYALAALASGHPVVVSIHDAPLRMAIWNLPTRTPGPALRRLARSAHWCIRAAMAWRVARRTEVARAVSPHVRDHFARVLRCPGRIDVIPNLPDLDLWRAADSTGPNAGEPSRRPFDLVAVLGTWGGLKNAETLLRAFARCRQRGLHARLALVGGDFGPGGAAARWADAHDLATDVDFLGGLANDEVFDRLRAADLLVHPSREEAAGMVLMEAQLVSTAVVGDSESGGVAWSLGYGEAGALVDMRSAEVLADTIVSLATDRSLRDELARSGRELAIRRYEPESIVDSIEALFESAIENRGGRREHGT